MWDDDLLEVLKKGQSLNFSNFNVKRQQLGDWLMLINSHHQNIYNWTQGGGQFLALADHSSDGT